MISLLPLRLALKDLWLDQLRWLVPTDPRGIVLCCFFAFAAGIGAVALADGDPIGWAYLVGATAGWVFAQTRLMPTFLWLLVAGLGLWGVSGGVSGAWVEVAYALGLVVVSLMPVADPD